MTDNQLRERAEAKYPYSILMGDRFCVLQDKRREAYISAYKEAIEEMGKAWVSVETPPVDSKTLSENNPPQWWQCAMDNDVLLLPCEYYNGKWYPYTSSKEENRVKWYRPLPAPPSINKGKK